MTTPVFEVRRRDLNGYLGAVEIEMIDPGPLVTGTSFEDARGRLVAELRALLALAERLKEPTP